LRRLWLGAESGSSRFRCAGSIPANTSFFPRANAPISYARKIAGTDFNAASQAASSQEKSTLDGLCEYGNAGFSARKRHSRTRVEHWVVELSSG
jgi:hypothetical protein